MRLQTFNFYLTTSLREKQGTEFDQAYMDVMVSSHEDVIRRLEDLQDAEDMDIKSFTEMLPAVRQHHQQAQEIEDRVNTTGTRADRDNRRRTERESRGGYRYRVGDGAADGRAGTTAGADTGTTGRAGKSKTSKTEASTV